VNNVTQIARFPVKGFTAHIMDRVRLVPGEGVPMDRIMAVTDGTWRYEPDNYEVRYKDKFIALMTHPKAATLQLKADDNALHLSISAPDGQCFEIHVGDPGSEQPFLDFLAKFLDLPEDNRPELIRRTTGDFTDLTILDKAQAYHGSLHTAISMMNLASVRDLGARMGDLELDPRRLRANICFDTGTAWQEADWLGKYLRVGGVLAKVVMATPRCTVTSVNPDTGERDRGIVQNLLRFYRHKNLGIYIDVIEEGEVRSGDAIEILEGDLGTHTLIDVPFNGAKLPVYVRNSWLKED
jgi:uncharacterized protein YcbX